LFAYAFHIQISSGKNAYILEEQRRAIVIPVFKKGKRNACSNYQGIGLNTSCYSKVKVNLSLS
jgi:hypothetical protein